MQRNYLHIESSPIHPISEESPKKMITQPSPDSGKKSFKVSVHLRTHYDLEELAFNTDDNGVRVQSIKLGKNKSKGVQRKGYAFPTGY